MASLSPNHAAGSSHAEEVAAVSTAAAAQTNGTTTSLPTMTSASHDTNNSNMSVSTSSSVSSSVLSSSSVASSATPSTAATAATTTPASNLAPTTPVTAATAAPTEKKSTFKFSMSAKPFSFSTSAASFTPSFASTPATASSSSATPASSSSSGHTPSLSSVSAAISTASSFVSSVQAASFTPNAGTPWKTAAAAASPLGTGIIAGGFGIGFAGGGMDLLGGGGVEFDPIEEYEVGPDFEDDTVPVGATGDCVYSIAYMMALKDINTKQPPGIPPFLDYNLAPAVGRVSQGQVKWTSSEGIAKTAVRATPSVTPAAGATASVTPAAGGGHGSHGHGHTHSTKALPTVPRNSGKKKRRRGGGAGDEDDSYAGRLANRVARSEARQATGGGGSGGPGIILGYNQKMAAAGGHNSHNNNNSGSSSSHHGGGHGSRRGGGGRNNPDEHVLGMVSDAALEGVELRTAEVRWVPKSLSRLQSSQGGGGSSSSSGAGNSAIPASATNGTGATSPEATSAASSASSSSSSSSTAAQGESSLPVTNPPGLGAEEVEERRATVMATLLSILNKLTPDNFSKLAVQALACATTVPTLPALRQMVRVIFEKAVGEPKFAGLYARFSAALALGNPDYTDSESFPSSSTHFSSSSSSSSSSASAPTAQLGPGPFIPEFVSGSAKRRTVETFKKCLLQECYKQLVGELTNTLPPGVNAAFAIRKDDSEEDRALKLRNRVRGTVIFMGELFRQSLLPRHVIYYCMDTMLTDESMTTEEEVENLCDFLRTVGKLLDGDAKLERSNNNNNNNNNNNTAKNEGTQKNKGKDASSSSSCTTLSGATTSSPAQQPSNSPTIAPSSSSSPIVTARPSNPTPLGVGFSRKSATTTASKTAASSSSFSSSSSSSSGSPPTHARADSPIALFDPSALTVPLPMPLSSFPSSSPSSSSGSPGTGPVPLPLPFLVGASSPELAAIRASLPEGVALSRSPGALESALTPSPLLRARFRKTQSTANAIANATANANGGTNANAVSVMTNGSGYVGSDPHDSGAAAFSLDGPNSRGNSRTNSPRLVTTAASAQKITTATAAGASSSGCNDNGASVTSPCALQLANVGLLGAVSVSGTTSFSFSTPAAAASASSSSSMSTSTSTSALSQLQPTGRSARMTLLQRTQKMDDYFSSIKRLAQPSRPNALPSRLRYMLQDLVELRERNWVARTQQQQQQQQQETSSSDRHGRDGGSRFPFSSSHSNDNSKLPLLRRQGSAPMATPVKGGDRSSGFGHGSGSSRGGGSSGVVKTPVAGAPHPALSSRAVSVAGASGSGSSGAQTPSLLLRATSQYADGASHRDGSATSRSSSKTAPKVSTDSATGAGSARGSGSGSGGAALSARRLGDTSVFAAGGANAVASSSPTAPGAYVPPHMRTSKKTSLHAVGAASAKAEEDDGWTVVSKDRHRGAANNANNTIGSKGNAFASSSSSSSSSSSNVLGSGVRGGHFAALIGSDGEESASGTDYDSPNVGPLPMPLPLPLPVSSASNNSTSTSGQVLAGGDCEDNVDNDGESKGLFRATIVDEEDVAAAVTELVKEYYDCCDPSEAILCIQELKEMYLKARRLQPDFVSSSSSPRTNDATILREAKHWVEAQLHRVISGALLHAIENKPVDADRCVKLLTALHAASPTMLPKDQLLQALSAILAEAESIALDFPLMYSAVGKVAAALLARHALQWGELRTLLVNVPTDIQDDDDDADDTNGHASQGVPLNSWTVRLVASIVKEVLALSQDAANPGKGHVAAALLFSSTNPEETVLQSLGVGVLAQQAAFERALDKGFLAHITASTTPTPASSS